MRREFSLITLLSSVFLTIALLLQSVEYPFMLLILTILHSLIMRFFFIGMTKICLVSGLLLHLFILVVSSFFERIFVLCLRRLYE